MSSFVDTLVLLYISNVLKLQQIIEINVYVWIIL